jgi:hypothetical protein
LGGILTPRCRKKHCSWSDSIHPNVRRQCTGEGARHLDDARLCNPVWDVGGPRLERRQVGEVDDCALSSSEVRRSGLRCKERRAEVDGEHLLPRGRRHLTDWRPQHHGGGVHQDIEVSQGLHRRSDERLRRANLTDVRLEASSSATGALNLSRRLASASFGAAVVDGNVEPATT